VLDDNVVSGILRGGYQGDVLCIGTQVRVHSQHPEAFGEWGDHFIWLRRIGALKIVDECSSNQIYSMNASILCLIKERRHPVVGMIFLSLNDIQKDSKT
jgi:hypothetical protein